jgi:hypothetical protein
MKYRDHDRAAGETAEQPADDDAAVLHAIQALSGNTFPAPIDGTGFSRMVTPPILTAEATRRGGATDRRRVSPCPNEDPYACGRVVFSESFCGSRGLWCSVKT